MALNVFNVFLVLCCYIFSKHNLIHPPTRFYLTLFVVPLFSVATMLLMMVTASSGVASLMNADFCAGGQGMGSPQGTIRDAIFSYQHGSISSSSSSVVFNHDPQTKNDLTGTLDLVYESFSYYANVRSRYLLTWRIQYQSLLRAPPLTHSQYSIRSFVSRLLGLLD
jgi:hypothetical protein